MTLPKQFNIFPAKRAVSVEELLGVSKSGRFSRFHSHLDQTPDSKVSKSPTVCWFGRAKQSAFTKHLVVCAFATVGDARGAQCPWRAGPGHGGVPTLGSLLQAPCTLFSPFSRAFPTGPGGAVPSIGSPSGNMNCPCQRNLTQLYFFFLFSRLFLHFFETLLDFKCCLQHAPSPPHSVPSVDITNTLAGPP